MFVSCLVVYSTCSSSTCLTLAQTIKSKLWSAFKSNYLSNLKSFSTTETFDTAPTAAATHMEITTEAFSRMVSAVKQGNREIRDPTVSVMVPLVGLGPAHNVNNPEEHPETAPPTPRFPPQGLCLCGQTSSSSVHVRRSAIRLSRRMRSITSTRLAL